MKQLLTIISILLLYNSSIADITVPSTYDPQTDTWIGNVDALTNALVTAPANSIIYLEKGIYDISMMTNSPMAYPSGSDYGATLLNLKTGLQLVGITKNPKDVVITASNSEYRLIILRGNSKLYNLTVSGGNASSLHITSYNYRRGGGVLFSGSGSIVSNCVFTGNKASTSGGAVSGPNSMLGTVYDSVFYNNADSSQGGVVACQTTFYNCIFTNNISTKETSGNWSASIVENCTAYNSYFSKNQCSKTGGMSSSLAVNCKFFFNSQNNPNGNNWSNPGGGALYNCTATNCIFYGNRSYRLGGAVRKGKLVNCTVISNTTIHATDAYGGGIYEADLVENCNVSSNISIIGGGLSHCKNVVNCNIKYNKANEGGGGNLSSFTNCTISQNVALSYKIGNNAGAGGGIRDGYATNCVFKDNSASATYLTKVLKNCKIFDNCINAEIIDSCTIQNLNNFPGYTSIKNVSYPNGYLTSNMYAFVDIKLMKNCLITNCIWSSSLDNFSNTSFYYAYNSISTRVENCTIVDNYYKYLARSFNSNKKQICFINTILFANTKPNSDISGYDSPYLVVSNCVFSKIGTRTQPATGYEDYNVKILTKKDQFRFLNNKSTPYMLRLTSPLRLEGIIIDGMENDTDLIGNPRLQDNKVDIGCYQSWFLPNGLDFYFK